MHDTDSKPSIALVLSGGGVRGAYEAGVARGIIETLSLTASQPAPIQIFAGTSVGAINAAFLASNAHRGDLATNALVRLWESLTLGEYFRLRPWGLLGKSPSRLLPLPRSRRSAPPERSLIDPEPFRRLVEQSIDWMQLQKNIDGGLVEALLIAALDVGSGKTSIFADLAPGACFRPSRDPRRQTRRERVAAAHVLASAAIPLLFPAQQVGSSYHCDGGLRFNTPIAPAIRAGADRLVVVSLMHRAKSPNPGRAPAGDPATGYPSLTFLLGKVLDALLLDPVAYDLQVLSRFNRILDVLDRTLPADAKRAVDDVLTEARGAPYRRLRTLVVTPSQDIGVIAASYIRDNARGLDVGWLSRWLLSKAADPSVGLDADFASYMLFDGAFASELIQLGRRDILARAADVRAFFDPAG